MYEGSNKSATLFLTETPNVDILIRSAPLYFEYIPT